MEPYEYKRMHSAEQDHWWYGGLRLFWGNVIDKLRLSPGSHILDAGCGTGANLKHLFDKGYRNLSGFDLNDEAVNFVRQRGFSNVIKADVNAIPYKASQFDFILCSDVFECSEVSEQRAYDELLRVLKPGGRLVIIAAAFQSLLSEHDRAVHSVRRYSKKSAIKSFQRKGVSVRVRYLFFSTFFCIAGYRLIKNIFTFHDKLRNPRSDLWLLPGFLNRALYFLIYNETKSCEFISFPWGTSLMIEAIKD